jgi:hypothetical protein
MGYKWDTSGQRKFRSLISSKLHVTNLEKCGWREGSADSREVKKVEK